MYQRTAINSYTFFPVVLRFFFVDYVVAVGVVVWISWCALCGFIYLFIFICLFYICTYLLSLFKHIVL